MWVGFECSYVQPPAELRHLYIKSVGESLVLPMATWAGSAPKDTGDED